MWTKSSVVLFSALLCGCAETKFYREDGTTEMPGLPFVWTDANGESQLGYVTTTAGFASPTNFTVVRNPDGSYAQFASNIHHTVAGQWGGPTAASQWPQYSTGFEAGRRKALAEMKSRIGELPDSITKGEVLRMFEEFSTTLDKQ